MADRKTSDYGNLKEGTAEYKAAVSGRKEMLKWFGMAPMHNPPKRRSWLVRMCQSAKGFGSKENMQRHEAAEQRRHKERKEKQAA